MKLYHSLIRWLELPVIFTHELLHYIPAWLFGLKPIMALDADPPVTGWDYHESVLVNLIIILLPAIALSPLYFIAIYRIGFPVSLFNTVMLCLLSLLWLHGCSADLRLAFKLIRYGRDAM